VKRSDRRWLVCVLLAAMSFGVPARAQKSPRVGELIEAHIVGDADTPSGQVCRAWLGAVAGDTLLLNRSASCMTGRHVAHVRVHRDDRGSRLTHAAVGLVVGAVVGGVIGRASAGACGPTGCGDDAGYVTGIRTLVYGVTGALAGVVVGTALPAGPRWIDLSGEHPIRVGSLDLRPALRLSLGERLR
jgi:hypothetical protein